MKGRTKNDNYKLIINSDLTDSVKVTNPDLK